MNSVGYIGGNIGDELDSIMGSALFLKLFPRYTFSYTLRIYLFPEFPLDIFKVVS